MMASGWLCCASRRPISAFIAVRTSYPSSRSIRANVCVTPSSSSTMRIVAVASRAGSSTFAVPRGDFIVTEVDRSERPEPTGSHVTLQAFGEPDSGAACPRAARARPHHSPAPGQEPPSVRGRHQPRHRAERAGQQRHLDPVSRRRPRVAGARASACRRWSRSRPASRSITSKRSRSGRTFAKLRTAVSPVRAVRHGRRRPPAVRGQPDSRRAKSGATSPSATTSGSRSSIEAAKPCLRRGPRPVARPAAPVKKAAAPKAARGARQAALRGPKAAKKPARAAETKVGQCPSSESRATSAATSRSRLVHVVRPAG